MIGRKKLLATMMVLVLVFSVSTALFTPASGVELSQDEDFSDDYVEITDVEPMDAYIGEEEVQFGVAVENLAFEDGDIDNVTDVRVSVDTDADVDWVHQVEPPMTVDGVNMTEPANQTFVFGYDDGADFDAQLFEFDVDPDADHGEYEMEIVVSYAYVDEEGQEDTETLEAAYEFEIMKNAEVHDIDPVWAGVNNQDVEVEIENVGITVLEDIELTLDTPAGISLRDEMAYIPGTLVPGETRTAHFRIDVDNDVDPDIYDIEYTLETTRDDVEIEEEDEIELPVDFTPRITMEEDDEIEVEQGEREVTFDTTFVNTGNVDLIDVHVSLITDDYYFVEAVDHYEYGEDIVDPVIPLGDLDVGDEEELEFTVGLHRYLHDGLHNLLFRWDGEYYNDGSLGDATQYEHVGVDWDRDESPSEPFLYEVYEDNHEYDEEDIELERPWEGPNRLMDVTAVTIDITGEIIYDIDLEDEIKDESVEVMLENHELVGFDDLDVIMETGENTPFLNPTDHDKDHVEMTPRSDDSIDPSDAIDPFATVYFTVDINTEYVDEMMEKRVSAYTANLTITSMLNRDTNEEIHDIPIDVSGSARGLGPRLAVEADLRENQMEDGERFNVTYTIRNEGDDSARDTWIEMRPDQYDNENWEVLHGFIWATSSTEEEMELNITDNDYMSLYARLMQQKNVSEDVTLEQLGIEDGEDIADLHLYFEGALTGPEPHVWELFIDEIAPGQEVTVDFQMATPEAAHIDHTYDQNVTIDYIDSYGEDRTEDYTVTLGPAIVGDEVVDEEPTESLYGVIIVLAIVVVALIVVILTKTKSKKGPTDEEESLEDKEEIDFEESEDTDEEPDWDSLEDERTEAELEEEPPEEIRED